MKITKSYLKQIIKEELDETTDGIAVEEAFNMPKRTFTRQEAASTLQSSLEKLYRLSKASRDQEIMRAIDEATAPLEDLKAFFSEKKSVDLGPGFRSKTDGVPESDLD